jgi:septum formation protein
MPPMSTPPRIVLASTSRYRRELLQRLRIPFDVESPQVDEHALADETPARTATRLAPGQGERRRRAPPPTPW